MMGLVSHSNSCITYICLLLALGLPSLMTALDVNGERITGEYNGLSRMRCSLYPSTLRIQFVEWYYGYMDTGKIVYIHQTYPYLLNEGRGKFEKRNVTGQFWHNDSTHELTISTSIPTDAGLYTCQIKSKSQRQFGTAYVNLTLVATADEPPGITDTSGNPLRTSNCSNLQGIPAVSVDGEMSLVCRVGGSNPYPTVEWHWTDSNYIIHRQTYYPTYISKGVSVKSAQRQIDIVLAENNTVMCTVAAPDASSGQLKRESMCLRIIKRAPDATTVLFYILPLAVFVIAWIVLLREYINLKRPYGIAEKRTQRGTFPTVLITYIGIRLVLDVLSVYITYIKRERLIRHGIPQKIHTAIYSTGLLFCGPIIYVIFPWKKYETERRDHMEQEMPSIELQDYGNEEETEPEPNYTDTSVILSGTLWLVIFAGDIAGTILYLVGLIWNYTKGECYWNNSSVIFLLFLVYLCCVSCLGVGFTCKKKEQHTKRKEEQAVALAEQYERKMKHTKREEAEEYEMKKKEETKKKEERIADE